jgi:SAM-dependent methyltransferase
MVPSDSDSASTPLSSTYANDQRLTLAHYDGLVDEAAREQTETLDRALYHQLIQLLPGGDANLEPTLLDAGCGTGEWLEAFTRLGLQAEGVDGSPHSVAEAEKKGLNVQHRDLRMLNLRRESFDAIWCTRTLPHFSIEDMQRILASFFQALKPRAGILVCDFHEGEGIRYEDRTLVTKYHGPQAGTDLPPRIWWGSREEAFLAMARQTGLQPTHRAEKPRDSASGLQSILYFMKRA